jgi:hypothetical protein
VARYEYIEGRRSTEKFEEGMKAFSEVPKERVVKAAKKQASWRS